MLDILVRLPYFAARGRHSISAHAVSGIPRADSSRSCGILAIGRFAEFRAGAPCNCSCVVFSRGRVHFVDATFSISLPYSLRVANSSIERAGKTFGTGIAHARDLPAAPRPRHVKSAVT